MYENRTEAGEALARELQGEDLPRPVVCALPRGGVPVALPVARALRAPLDLVLVRKIGVPGHEELAAGAIVDGPPEHIHFNDHVLSAMHLEPGDFDGVINRKREELLERRAAYLAGRARVDVRGRTVVLVDDGIATGATVRAALLALRDRHPAQIILAVPVAAADTLETLKPLVDRVVCPLVPRYFQAVGVHYRNFNQVPDAAVAEMMADAPVDEAD